jgi:hypothetical protein
MVANGVPLGGLQQYSFEHVLFALIDITFMMGRWGRRKLGRRKSGLISKRS